MTERGTKKKVSDLLALVWKSLLDPSLESGKIRILLPWHEKRMLRAAGWREPCPCPYVLCEEEIQ